MESDPVQSFSVSFTLLGEAKRGELVLSSPLGLTHAKLSWAPDGAFMTANGEVRQFESLGALTRQATGTDLPVAALFAWLAGDSATHEGWQADLQELGAGRLQAKRLAPEPKVLLRIVLDEASAKDNAPP